MKNNTHQLCIDLGNVDLSISSKHTLVFPGYWQSFLSTEGNKKKIHIEIYSGIPGIEFTKPCDYSFELSGREAGADLWSGEIFFGDGLHYLLLKHDAEIRLILKYGEKAGTWELYEDEKENCIIPPIDQFIFFMAISACRGLMLHASGVKIRDRGLVFCGISGAGKSTLANLFADIGARIVGDDRIGLQPDGSNIHMFPVPGYDAAEPFYTPVHVMLFPVHAKENELIPVEWKQKIMQAGSGMIHHQVFPELAVRQQLQLKEAMQCIPAYILACHPGKDTASEIFSLLKQEHPALF